MEELVKKYRRALSIMIHGLLFAGAYFLSFALRFDYDIPLNYLGLFLISLPLVMLVKIIVFDRFDLYQVWWRYASVVDLMSIIKASCISAFIIMAIAFVVFRAHSYPRSIPIIDLVLTVGLVGGLRFLVRAVREGSLSFSRGKAGTRVLILGAGSAGETLAREVHKSPSMNYELVGFLDDAEFKRGLRIQGARVLGPIASIQEVAPEYAIQEIFIAMPSATGEQMRRTMELCGKTGLPVKTIPGIDRLIDGRVTVSQLREVQIEDLLGRAPVNLDLEAIKSYLRGKRVLVTGAAGSIGSEICRQVLTFGPEQLILADHWENGIFTMQQEFNRRHLEAGTAVSYFVADITDRVRVRNIFQAARPDVVFHAAAYKHVPMMEQNPGEAVKNNVGGTRVLADEAEAAGCVERFVMISTDKAVNPTSVMGASKRVAERYVQNLSKTARTRFITVRFGNVLGSAGSVIPIFREQIARGGPVTVTHPDMTRYFMTIPEASQLVLQAGSMGRGGEILVLDMGDPVKIIDLATLMIKLSGLRPTDDIKIEFSGVRPGEKLFEELNLDDEQTSRTGHAKVFIRNCCDAYPGDFLQLIDRLIQSADHASAGEIKDRIKQLVPEYKHDPAPRAQAEAPAMTVSR